MRVSSANLGVYVPGRGLRDFVPGRFAVPQNPIVPGLSAFVPGRFVLPQVPVVTMQRNSLGEFVPAQYTLPQNPITDAIGIGDLTPTAPLYPIPENSVLQGAQDMGLAGLGCGCGCGGNCGGCGGGMSGISDDFTQLVADLGAGNFSAAWSDFTKALAQPVVGSVPLWVVVGSGLLLWVGVFSGGEQHSRYHRARRAYRAARGAYA